MASAWTGIQQGEPPVDVADGPGGTIPEQPTEPAKPEPGRGRGKPPWNDKMSEGCALPYWLSSQLGIIDRQIEACHPACIEHDRAYYVGAPGDEAARARADTTLELTVAPIVGVAWAGQWVQAVRLTGASHFGTGRTWDGRKFWEGAP